MQQQTGDADTAAINSEKAQRDCEAKLWELSGNEKSTRDDVSGEEREARLAVIREIALDLRAARTQENLRMQREKKQHTLDDRNTIIDHFVAMKGARFGAISFTVIRAENIGGLLSAAMLHTNSFCVVSYNNVEFESDVVKRDECPEYRFNTYFSIPNDTWPIVVTIMERPVSSRLGPGIMVGSSSVNLRGQYSNLVRSAPDGVYTEKGSLILPLYDSSNRKRDGMSITVEWSLELRDANRVATCDWCGRVESRCDCTAEEKQAQRDQLALETQQRLAKEMVARSIREAQEGEVVDRDAVLDEYHHETNMLARNMRIDRDAVRAEARRRALEARGVSSGAAVVPAAGPPPNDSVSQNPHDPVDVYAREDLNVRGAAGPIMADGRPAKKQEGGCCIVS